ncbi:MAG: tetratricopeptide repeat protein [Candidatus Heimdallarchaeota archaeon]|nr:tetratricopeptide repeat protein [Candidatus Heimdallarchaeota archaeon]
MLVLDKITAHINNGEYQFARILISVLPDNNYLQGKVLRSRIDELNGFFQYSLNLSNYVLDQLDNESSELYFDAINAKLYALWRLKNFDVANKLIEEVSAKLANTNPLSAFRSSLATFNNISGLIMWSQDQLEPAEERINFGLQIREELNEQLSISYSNNNLGNVALKRKDFDLAHSYFKKSHNIRKELGSKPAIAGSWNSFGRYFDAVGEYDKATEYHQKSINLWHDLENTQFKAKSIRFLGLNSFHKGKQDEALQLLEEAIEYFDLLDNEIDINTTKSLKQMIEQN